MVDINGNMLKIYLATHNYPNEKIWIIRSHEDFQNIDDVIKNILISDVSHETI